MKESSFPRAAAARRRDVRLRVVAMAIVVVGLTRLAGAQGWPDVFYPLRLLSLNLELDPDDWLAVQRDLTFDLEVPARFWAGGEQAVRVSVRRKPGDALGPKVSLKIDINEYEDQTWHGLKKVSLENGYDTDVISEGFAWYLHRLASESSRGVYEAGLANWVRLSVNGEYLGVYVSVEQRDKQFLINRNLFTKKKTWLYKKESSGDAELEVGTPKPESLCYVPFAVPTSKNGLTKGACDTPDDDTLAAELPMFVDMDAMLTQGAVDAFLSNAEGLFSRGRNFYYADFGDDRARPRMYFPWNLDTVFTSSEQSIHGTLKGGTGPGLYRTPFQDVLLGHPVFGDQYRTILDELVKGPFSTEQLHRALDNFEELLTRSVEADPWNNLEVSVAERFDQLGRYVDERFISIQRQLWGESDPDVAAPVPSKTSYIQVEDARGRPGEIVEVLVKGGTHVKVNGFAFAVGMGQRLRVESVELGEFFREALGNQLHFVQSVFPSGAPEPYFNVFLGFYGVSGQRVSGVAPAIVIPPDTTLIKVKYRIPFDHPAPSEQLLLNRTAWFRKTPQTPRVIAVTSMYTTESDVSRYGITPILVSGKLYVEE